MAYYLSFFIKYLFNFIKYLFKLNQDYLCKIFFQQKTPSMTG